MKSSDRNLNLTSYDDIFQTEETRIEASQEKVIDIPLTQLHSFKNHPFKGTDDESMLETAESITKHGVLVPVIVRPREEGGYELISGHRRKRASELAGKETLPCIVRNLDDDAATIIMVDSNIQRENILPSERAFAYKLKLEAMKRQAGRPSKENGSQVGNNLMGVKSSDILAKQMGKSKSTIFRYIRSQSLFLSCLIWSMPRRSHLILRLSFHTSCLMNRSS